MKKISPMEKSRRGIKKYGRKWYLAKRWMSVNLLLKTRNQAPIPWTSTLQKEHPPDESLYKILTNMRNKMMKTNNPSSEDKQSVNA